MTVLNRQPNILSSHESLMTSNIVYYKWWQDGTPDMGCCPQPYPLLGPHLPEALRSLPLQIQNEQTLMWNSCCITVLLCLRCLSFDLDTGFMTWHLTSGSWHYAAVTLCHVFLWHDVTSSGLCHEKPSITWCHWVQFARFPWIGLVLDKSKWHWAFAPDAVWSDCDDEIELLPWQSLDTWENARVVIPDLQARRHAASGGQGQGLLPPVLTMSPFYAAQGILSISGSRK